MSLDLFQIECENCGAIIDRDNAVHGVLRCEYCRRSYVLPKEDQVSEVLVELELGKTSLNACAFTKAYGAYAKAVELDPTEPEGYFGMALAENKIQYVKDVVLDKLKPIRYERSGGKFSENAHYKKAISLANKDQAAVYKEYAKEIDEIFAEFEKMYSANVEYDCYLAAPVEEKIAEQKVVAELYERLKTDDYKPFALQEERKRFPKVSEAALELFALVSAKCFVTVCFDEVRLRNKQLKNDYSRFIDINKSVRKPKNNLTILFNEKPVEQIPGIYGKLQGIRYGDAFAYRDLTRYVDVMLGRVKPATGGGKKGKIGAIAAAVAVLVVGGTVAGIALGSKPDGDGTGGAGDKPAEFVYSAIGADGYKISSVILNGNTTLVLPSEYEGLPVTAIEEGLFYNCSELTKLTLPTALTSISANAFLDCSSLEELVIPDTVKEIGANAFSGCSSLTSLTLPQSVTTLGDGAFKNCSSLTEFVLPQTLTALGDGVFSGCSSLQSVSVDFALVDYTFGGFFGTEYFSGSTAVYQRNTSYYLPDSLTTITVTGDDLPFGAFQNCAKVKSISLNGEITSIPNTTFQGCSALTTLSLPQTLKSVGVSAFSGCASLPSIELSELVTSVGEKAFMNCSSLKIAKLNCPTVSIGMDVFYGCAALEEMTVPCQTRTLAEYFGTEAVATMTEVLLEDVAYYVPAIEKLTLVGQRVTQKGVYGFANLKTLELAQTLTEIEESAFLNCVSLQGVDFTRVTKVGDLAFENCSSLTQIHLPLTIENYGKQIFKGCSSIQELTFSFFDENRTLSYLFGKTENSAIEPLMETEVIYHSVERSGEGYDIPTSLKTLNVIGDNLPEGALKNFAYIHSVNLGEGITQIKTSTFYACSALKNFSSQAEITSIQNYAFYGCASLVDYPLSQSAQSLGESAFEGCSSLKQIFIPTAITELEKKTFYQCAGLETAEVSHVTSFGESAFEGCSSLVNLSIAAAQDLYTNAFKDCSALQSLTVPQSAQSFGADVFDGLTGLTSLTWSVTGGATYLSNCFFDNMGNATDGVEVTFAENVESIPTDLLASILKVKKITFAGENVTSVSSGAFTGLSNLQEVVSPSINAWFKISFANATANPLQNGADLVINGKAVTEIILPNDVTKIPNYQFYGFVKLNSFIFHENLESIGDLAFNGCTGITKIDVGSIQHWAGLYFGGSHPLGASKGDLYENGVLIKELSLSSSTISSCAFKNTTVTSISVDTGVNTVGEEAFSGNENVERIYWNANAATVKINSFQDVGKSVANGVEVTIGPNVTTVQSYLFSKVASVTKINFAANSGLTKIDAYAFSNAKISEVTIPETVTVINDGAFFNCVNLTSIEIPETVTTVYSNAFGDCKSLQSIFWNATNSAQNVKVFEGSGADSGLTITLGENVTQIPAYFAYGAKVTKLVIPETTNLQSIGNYALAGAQFTSFTVPDTVTNIGTGVFQNCTALVELTVPFFGLRANDTNSSTTRINNLFNGAEPASFKKLTVTNDDVPASAFYSALRVEEVVLQKDDLTIGKNAFQYVNSLKRVVCAGNVLLIDETAFKQCTALQTITINGELTDVGMEAFSGDTALMSVSATRIGSIGQSSFYGCSALTELPKFDANSYVGNGSFSGCNGGLNIRADSFSEWCSVGYMLPYSNPLSQTGASLYIDGKLVETAELTDVEIINTYAFYAYAKLTKVVLGESVTQIGKQAFSGCTNLAEIETHCKAEYLENAFSSISATAQVNIINMRGWCESTFADSSANPATAGGKYYENGEPLVDLEIPEGTTKIAAYAFWNCYTMNTLKVPTSVENAGEYAFYQCRLADIYWNARACEDLYKDNAVILLFDKTCVSSSAKISLTIGPDVEIVPSYLFYEIYKGKSSTATEVTSLTFLSTICQKVGNYLFKSDYLYATKKLGYVDIADINAWAQIDFGLNYANPLRFANQMWINGERVGTEITLDNSITRIGSATFIESSKFGITKINMPSALEEIGSNAFWYSSGLTDITIPETVTKIESYAFYYCSNATFNNKTTLDFLGNLTTLGSSAFSGCSKITELVVPNNPNFDYSLPNMFSNFSVENITVEDGVEVIGDNMFSFCKVPGTLTIPASVTTVGSYILSQAEIGTLIWNANDTREKTRSDTILANSTITAIKVGKNVTVIPDYFTGYYVDYYTKASAYIQNVVFEEDSACEKIGDYAFYEAGIRTCNFPASLKYIGDSAFYDTPLQECVFEEGLEHIGQFAFDWCEQLTSVSIPTTLKYYGARAFSNCAKLEYVYWNAEACADIEHIQYENGTGYCNPFAGISTEATFVIGNKVKIVPAYLCFQTNAKEIIFEENSICEEIHSEAFRGTSKATTLSLPASLKLIQRYGIGYSDRCSFTDVIFEGDGNWKISWTTTEVLAGKVQEVAHTTTLTASMLTDSKQNLKYFINYVSSSSIGYGNCIWTKM